MPGAIAVGVAVVLLGSVPAAAAQTRRLSGFTSLEVLDIDNQRNERGERIPPESIPKLKGELEGAIAALHLFQRIGETTDGAVRERIPERVVQLRIKIVGYTGSRNGTRITATLTLIDRETQRPVLEKRISARPGLLDIQEGAFLAVIRRLVRSVTDVVQDNW